MGPWKYEESWNIYIEGPGIYFYAILNSFFDISVLFSKYDVFEFFIGKDLGG